MASENDRIARAGDYVFGLMDERERARAERDLRIDPAFRDAVLRLAQRLRTLDPDAAFEGASDDRWRLVAQRIGELPQMRPACLDDGESKSPVVVHRLERGRRGVGLQALGGRLGLVIGVALLAAFAFGYLVGSL